MSSGKSLGLDRLNDVTLGSFRFVPTSETLNHLIRYLGTWSGSDKMFMVVQYTVKLLVPFLNLRARWQHKAGRRSSATSVSAQRYSKLDALIGDSRTLWRIWGLLPIFQWLISIERNPPLTRRLLTIERLQGWSMLAYYPLEHIAYLCSKGILPSTFPALSSLWNSKAKPVKLDLGRLSIWSVRFWALYVGLQIMHLREDAKLLKARERNLRRASGSHLSPAEKEELRSRWSNYWNEVLVNVGYLPLTIHWSLEKGIFTNDVWVGVFGLIAAVASFRSGWQATALHPPTSPNPEVPASNLVDSVVAPGVPISREFVESKRLG